MSKVTLSGKALIDEYIRRYGRTALLAFSRGKDSIATAIALRDHLDLIPYYLIDVPGLPFVEESLDYYERKLFFGRHIIRLPHPSFYRHINNLLFQTPERAEVIAAARLSEITFEGVRQLLLQETGLDDDAIVAVGARAKDSALRLMSFKRYGAIRPSSKSWWPIWDWDKARLVSEIGRAGISLPIDYLLFSHSFDGFTYQYIKPIKDHLPDDYRRIQEWYPLIDAELKRYELSQRP